MSTLVPSVVEVAAPAANELFALSDEQILDIQPDAPEAHEAPLVIPSEARDLSSSAASARPLRDSSPPSAPRNDSSEDPAVGHGTRSTERAPSAEPPPWLARQMNDPWSGDEARDLWNGVVQARNEAAAYREVFAKPEEARAAAERARNLEEIDAAFFGRAGKSPQEISAGRAALAQRMLREDPAAFREMVFTGLRALESASLDASSVAPPFRAASSGSAAFPDLAVGATLGSPVANGGSESSGGASPAPTSSDAQLAAYRSFEKSANEELERSIGAAIQHSLEQALPNISRMDRSSGVATRLQQSVRDGVEIALKSDQQLGEQLARVLTARRFNEATRSQVVRLINDRAQQLVPVAARRVIQDWTQTAFAAQRGKGANGTNTFEGVGAGLASPGGGQRATQGSPLRKDSASRASVPTISVKAAAADRAERDGGLALRSTARPSGCAVDYSRLSDEQILDL